MDAIYVCLYVCMYVHMYVCMYSFVSACWGHPSNPELSQQATQAMSARISAREAQASAS